MKLAIIAMVLLAWSGPVSSVAPLPHAPVQQPTQQPAAAQTQASPETVMATFRVKPDQLAAFLKMMPEYWETLRRLNFVDAEPHLLMQGEEDGKPIVVQVFTWKSDENPDHAPPEVKQYWTQMNAMVETRNGHPGIEFPPMKLVDIDRPAPASTK